MDWMLMPLRRYADFQGRSRRMEFWMWQVFLMLLNFAILILFMLFGGAALFASMAQGGAAPSESGIAAMGVGIVLVSLLSLVVGLGLLIPNIAVAVRRLHDTNRSGWWLLAPVVPYVVMVVGTAQQSALISGIGGLVVLVMAIVLLVFYFLDGTPADNRFGPDPKARGGDEIFN